MRRGDAIACGRDDDRDLDHDRSCSCSDGDGRNVCSSRTLIIAIAAMTATMPPTMVAPDNDDGYCGPMNSTGVLGIGQH